MMADEEDSRPSLRPQSMSRGAPGPSLRPQSGLRPGAGGSSGPPSAASVTAPRPASPPSATRDDEDDDDDDADDTVQTTNPIDIDEKDDQPHDKLETNWVFWFDKRQDANGRGRTNQKEYQSNLKIVGEFDTIQDFWRFYNHMRTPADIEFNANYHLFKSGINPMWEDPNNAKGGKWIIQVKGKDKEKLLNSYWESVVLAMIGENLDDTREEICGAVMSRRKAGDKIAVWNRTNSEKVIMSIGRAIKNALFEGGVAPPDFFMSYQLHNESLASGSSYTSKALYQL